MCINFFIFAFKIEEDRKKVKENVGIDSRLNNSFTLFWLIKRVLLMCSLDSFTEMHCQGVKHLRNQTNLVLK